MALLLHYLHAERITGKTAKKVLSTLFEHGLNGNDRLNVKDIVDQENLWFSPYSEAEYEELGKIIMALNDKVVEEILAGKEGKINYLVGQMMREDKEGRVDALKAGAVLRRLVEELRG